MSIKRKFRSSNERFNVYAHIWLDCNVVKSFEPPYPQDGYYRIVEDYGAYLEVDPVTMFNECEDHFCPECKIKRTKFEATQASWFISKDAISVIRIEDKER